VTQTVRRVLDRRIELIGDRLACAADRGELPPVDPLFFAYLATGPVQMYVNRRERFFTRSEGERIADVVLAGLRST
jgi:hypothetical protein